MCGWTDVDGTGCCLEDNHDGLHEFGLAPNDEYFEEEEEENQLFSWSSLGAEDNLSNP
jgi:hypothetical protein